MLINRYDELVFFLRQLRITQDLNREDLAAFTGKSKSTITKYEQGMLSMNLPVLMKYLECVGCHIALIPEESLTPQVAELLQDTVGEHINWSIIHRNRRRGVVDVSKKMPRFLETVGRRGSVRNVSRKLEDSKLLRKRQKKGTSNKSKLLPSIKDMPDDYNRD